MRSSACSRSIHDAIAMEGNRYPITQIGIANLTHRLIEVATHDKNYGECDVQFRKGATVNKAPSP